MHRARSHWLKPPGPIAPGMTIGLLGGSFNPAHEGHLHVSDVALKQLKLDYVWWLVAPQNPLKPTAGMAPLTERVAQTARKFENNPRIVVIDVETALGTRYTIDTLTALKRRFRGVHFVWLMGSDNLAGFRRWKRWADIARLAPIAVVMRPGSILAPLSAKPMQRFASARRDPASVAGFARAKPPAFIVLDGPRSNASSTAIRAKLHHGEALLRMLPA
ncbi:MAG TPA: nicotinate-nucleotide adenylyltransferase [Rhizomicrobium sp.]|jgi:nicotinate-nucleotide adenylyltransferase|nr:nicotinate-nucleotide adenylyltransferase [Rhizomicrobium sp.]